MDRHMKIIYMTPCILFLIVMVVFPLLYTFRLSFLTGDVYGHGT